jgi:hypothetical protein
LLSIFIVFSVLASQPDIATSLERNLAALAHSSVFESLGADTLRRLSTNFNQFRSFRPRDGAHHFSLSKFFAFF